MDHQPLTAVRIERLSLSHLDALCEAALESIPETFPWLEWCHPGLTVSELADLVASMEQLWAQDKAYVFSIFDVTSRRYLGVVGINRIDRMYQMGNLHYWVRTSCTRGGVATAAARQAIDFGFRDLGLQRIEVVVPAGNAPSDRVAQRIGAVKEGFLRNRVRLHGKPHNATMYCLLPPSELEGAAA